MKTHTPLDVALVKDENGKRAMKKRVNRRRVCVLVERRMGDDDSSSKCAQIDMDEKRGEEGARKKETKIGE